VVVVVVVVVTYCGGRSVGVRGDWPCARESGMTKCCRGDENVWRRSAACGGETFQSTRTLGEPLTKINDNNVVSVCHDAFDGGHPCC